VRGDWSTKYVIKIAKYLLITCCGVLLSTLALAKLSGSLSADAITERLKPMGEVNIIGAPAPGSQPAAASAGVGGPKDIYENNCKMCHQTGVAGAPKFGDNKDWAPRISQGLDALVQAAWTGIRAMPPKGNCLKCTQEDIKATVEYMIDASK
jgi:cytochrome c5